MLSKLLCAGEDPAQARLFRDLELVRIVDERISKKLPLIRNEFGMVGYFSMPSARMGTSGAFGFGYSYSPPYTIWSLSSQLFDHLEGVGSYWVYRGLIEKNFGHLGYGDDSERSASIKIGLLRKEDGFAFLPDLSIGWIDFLGSCRFNSFFAAATEEWVDYNVEATLGWGKGRIKGFFGGISWSPIPQLSLVAEYDANDYKKHPYEHPSGRSVKSRINVGARCALGNALQASVHSLRGTTWSAAVSLHHDFGSPKGFFPKIYDPPTSVKPLDFSLRGEEFAASLSQTFLEQGFDLYRVCFVPREGGKDLLWVKVLNARYRDLGEVRRRLQRVLSRSLPSDVVAVTVVVEADGIPAYEYRFRAADLRKYREGFLGEREFEVVSPVRDATAPPSVYEGVHVYQRRHPTVMVTARPRMLSFFGSSSGKFKGQVGLSLTLEGFLLDQVYYVLQGSFTAFSQLQDVKSWDVLNPSRIINVRTDSLLYHQAHSFHLDSAYLQRSWHLGQGFFSRLSGGYFETAYGGVAAEFLYFPTRFCWAVGVEGAVLWKRSYYGFGFTHSIRKLTPEGLIHVPFTGVQYFVNWYYQYQPLCVDFKVSVGQFLARDKGIRIEGGRIFLSGVRLGLWYTFTNAHDVVNHKRYYDKGLSLSVPLDLFMNQSSRTRAGTAMAAWLRDCGAKAYTGKELYQSLFWERYAQRK